MNLGLDGKVILITGGAKGIGAAIVRMILRERGLPIVIDKDAQAFGELKSALQEERGEAHFLECDLCSRDNTEVAFGKALKLHGRLDGLVNNAGINDRVGLEAGSPQDFVVSLERNLFHYYNATHFALPALKVSKGAIVNIASKVALTGQGGTSGYAAAKGAILALTREWAVELAPFEIRVNAILPAEVMTPLYQRWLNSFENPAEKRDAIASKIPLGKRFTEPAEIASATVFLLSEQASHITGQQLSVDGGYVHLDRALT